MPGILCVGTDPSLLYTRAMVIARTGAPVTNATLQAGLPLLRQCPFELLILCHSIQAEDLPGLCGEARACCPAIRILLVEAPGSRAAAVEVEDRFAVEEGPHRLLEAVGQLLSARPQDLLSGPGPRGCPVAEVGSQEVISLPRPAPVTGYAAAGGEDRRDTLPLRVASLRAPRDRFAHSGA